MTSPHNNDRHPPFQPILPKRRVLIILSALMGFASISTDLYLPAMPAMGLFLHAETGQIELTISGYLIGFSLGQLVWGPISDRYGRRISVAAGLIFFIIGSAGCALSPTASSLIGWRIVQAIGACASVAISRAMVRDLYQGRQAAQVMSTLMMVMAIAPLIGPLVGGQILIHASWRAIFWSLVGVGAFTLASLCMIPETLPQDQRNRSSLVGTMFAYADLLRSPRLTGYLGTGSFFYAGLYAYIAGTPFTYITYYHVPERLYGLLFALGVIGIMASNYVNSRLVLRLGGDRILLLGTGLAAISAVSVAISARTDMGALWGLLIPLLGFVTATGFIVANSITGALMNHPDRAGAVSALTGAFQYGSGIVGSALVGFFSDGTPWPMGWVIGLCGMGSVLSMLLLSPQTPPHRKARS